MYLSYTVQLKVLHRRQNYKSIMTHKKYIIQYFKRKNKQQYNTNIHMEIKDGAVAAWVEEGI